LNNVNFVLFADDLVFNAEGMSVDHILGLLENTLSELNCDMKGLIINFDKTKVMIFHKVNERSIDIKPNKSFTCNSHKIERVFTFKYLGVWVDPSLQFSVQFDKVMSKVCSAIGCINYLKKFLNVNMFKTLLNCMLLSTIDYAFPIWGFSMSKSKLELLQKKIEMVAKCYFFPKLSQLFIKQNWKNQNLQLKGKLHNLRQLSNSISRYEILEKCNVLDVFERLKFQTLVELFKIMKFYNGVLALRSLYVFSTPRSNSVLARKRLAVPSHRTSQFQCGIEYKSIVLWNSLTGEIQDTTNSLSKFKQNLTLNILRSRLDVNI